MGSIFRYVADTALKTSDLGECQYCGRVGVPSYDYHGEIIDPSKAADSELARKEPEVFALCADCIHSGNVRKDDYEISRITGIVNRFAHDRPAAIANYHKIPHIPLMMQDDDWPMCCHDWCEYLGFPPDYEVSSQAPSLHQHWKHGPAGWNIKFELKPESLREVCIFRCLRCEKSYFIWQPT